MFMLIICCRACDILSSITSYPTFLLMAYLIAACGLMALDLAVVALWVSLHCQCIIFSASAILNAYVCKSPVQEG